MVRQGKFKAASLLPQTDVLSRIKYERIIRSVVIIDQSAVGLTVREGTEYGEGGIPYERDQAFQR